MISRVSPLPAAASHNSSALVPAEAVYWTVASLREDPAPTVGPSPGGSSKLKHERKDSAIEAEGSTSGLGAGNAHVHAEPVATTKFGLQSRSCAQAVSGRRDAWFTRSLKLNAPRVRAGWSLFTKYTSADTGPGTAVQVSWMPMMPGAQSIASSQPTAAFESLGWRSKASIANMAVAASATPRRRDESRDPAGMSGSPSGLPASAARHTADYRRRGRVRQPRRQGARNARFVGVLLANCAYGPYMAQGRVVSLLVGARFYFRWGVIERLDFTGAIVGGLRY